MANIEEELFEVLDITTQYGIELTVRVSIKNTFKTKAQKQKAIQKIREIMYKKGAIYPLGWFVE